MLSNRSLQVLFSFCVMLVIGGTGRADIISVSPGNYLYSTGTVTNALVDFTNWNPGACAGVSPCIVGASIAPATLFEDGFLSSITFTYGSDFDFDYPETGSGDRLILRYLVQPQAFSLDLGITGASFYLASAPQGIPDIGISPSTGLSSSPEANTNPGNYCYTFSQDLTGSSGSNYVDLSLPYSTTGSEVDIYLAVGGLNPNGGSFTITKIAPTSFRSLLVSCYSVAVCWEHPVWCLASCEHRQLRRKQAPGMPGHFCTS